jgi:hypothetical protein
MATATKIRFTPVQGQMAGIVEDAPAFPGDRFSLGFPEAIGDAAQALWYGSIQPEWKQAARGRWVSTGRQNGVLTYSLAITPHDDYVDADITLTNDGKQAWKQGMAFNCFNCGSSILRDNECLRHFVRVGGKFRRLVATPRVFGPRPTIQLYAVEGGPPAAQIPFVSNFRCTSPAVAEGWMAIVSPDGKRLAAAVSRPALFLFQNMEYSCIHSAPGFGPVRPGETKQARTRLYFVTASLEDWHRRMRSEMG